jgi:hypothetical protein
MQTNTYRVIEENPNSEPTITITQISYADEVYLKYDITNWGGSAVPIEKGEEFSKSLGGSIKYVKNFCDKGGNLG